MKKIIIKVLNWFLKKLNVDGWYVQIPSFKTYESEDGDIWLGRTIIEIWRDSIIQGVLGIDKAPFTREDYLGIFHLKN